MHCRYEFIFFYRIVCINGCCFDYIVRMYQCIVGFDKSLLFVCTFCKHFKSNPAASCLNGTTVECFFGCLRVPSHLLEFGWSSQATQGPLELAALPIARKKGRRRRKISVILLCTKIKNGNGMFWSEVHSRDIYLLVPWEWTSLVFIHAYFIWDSYILDCMYCTI